MSRKDALLRLFHRLVAEREALRAQISDELGFASLPDDGINDAAETAAHDEQSELHTQLAALESRELTEIEGALARFREGRFGVCDGCQKPIPIARLQALPFSNLCIDCQKRHERREGHDEFEANWASAVAHERRSSTQELSLSDLDVR